MLIEYQVILDKFIYFMTLKRQFKNLEKKLHNYWKAYTYIL